MPSSYASLRQSIKYHYRRKYPDIMLRYQLAHKLRVWEAYKAHTGRHSTGTHRHTSTHGLGSTQNTHSQRRTHKHTQAHQARTGTQKESTGTQKHTGTRSLTSFSEGNRINTDHWLCRSHSIRTMLVWSLLQCRTLVSAPEQCRSTRRPFCHALKTQLSCHRATHRSSPLMSGKDSL
jgi:hypothetical protein